MNSVHARFNRVLKPAHFMVVWSLLLTCSAALQAQVGAGSQAQCNANVTATPTLRGESYADRVADITISCIGGTVLQAGTPIPTVNITVFLNTTVTSRTYTNAISGSEALLLIDEPGSGVPGTTNTQLACNDPTGTCSITSTGGTLGTYDGSPGRPNIFPGVAYGNLVTFFAIPIEPPATGIVRTLRIANIRADAVSLNGGPNAGSVPVIASIAESNTSLLLISNPTPTVGFVQSGLTFSARTPDNSALSGSLAPVPCSTTQRVGVLRFGENFGTSFAARTSAPFTDSNTSPAPLMQNVPGQIWNSESGFYNPNLTAPNVDFATVGLSDAGTRFRATLNNLPPGTNVYVSATGVTYTNGNPSAATVGTVARLIQNEALPFSALAPTTTLEGVPAVQLPVTNGSATAVWEVLASNPVALENFDFVVWAQVSGTASSTVSVNGSLAPAPPTFTAADGAAASPTLPLPRFIADPNPAQSLFAAGNCEAITAPVLTAGTPTYGNQLAFSSTVGPPTPATSDTITFLDGATNIGTGNVNSSGVATVTTSSLLSAGTHSITAHFNGDSNFGTLTSNALNLTLGKANTTTSLGASPNPGFQNQNVTLTATIGVIGGALGGTVSFTNGGAPISGCSGVAVTGSTATCTVSFSAGSINLAANYGGDGNTFPSSGTFQETILLNPPMLSIGKSHTGNFTQGQQNATYTLTVSNVAGSASTSGTVTVTESAPAGLTLVSMAGMGWTCPNGGTTCTRSDALVGGTSYPAITVTVNVLENASSPQTNQVSVAGGGSPGAATSDATTILPQGLRFVTVTPCRIADTRKPAGPFGGPSISGGISRDFNIPASACSIPATAQAYSLNVTVVPAGSLGFLTLWPAGLTRPVASTLNSLDGRIKANAAIVPAGTGGAVSLFASNTTDVVLDINGYFVPATDPTALAFYPITPCRIADTRKPVGPLAGPSLVGGQSRTFPIQSSTCNLPATAQAYSLNLTVAPSGPLGYLTTWQTGQAKPVASSLNAPTGTITANAAIVPAGTSGSIDVFASNTSDLVIDVNGYFAPVSTGGMSLYNVTPCRVLDTRKPAGSQPIALLDVAVSTSACVIPVTAQAFVLGATVVPPGSLGYLTLWPQGLTRPLASTLNALDGAITSNMAIVPTTNGSISAFASNPTHLILDISGYFGQ